MKLDYETLIEIAATATERQNTAETTERRDAWQALATAANAIREKK